MRSPVLLPIPKSIPFQAWLVWAVPLACLLGALAIATPERNVEVFLAVNGWAATGPVAPWEWLTALGDTLTALCVLLMLARRRPDVVLAAIAAALVATLLTHGVKGWLDVPRPPAVLGEAAHVVGDSLRRGSFPSGHTATAFTLIAVLAAYLRSTAVLAGLLLLAGLVGVSRIAVGVHWPLDVCGGAFLGWISGLAGVWIMQRVGWQGRPRTLAGVRFVLLGGAIALLLAHDSGYPEAEWLERGVALAALLVHLAPRLRGRWWRADQDGFVPQAANSGSE